MKDTDCLHDAGHSVGAAAELQQEAPSLEVGHGLLAETAGLALHAQGDVIAVGTEGTRAYGAELARFLTANGITVAEVDRKDRKARRAQGSDPTDAYAAATAVLSGRASGTPQEPGGTA
ncbi:hypothetical protein ACVHNB_20130 [Streptomyces sp. YJ-C3]